MASISFRAMTLPRRKARRAGWRHKKASIRSSASLRETTSGSRRAPARRSRSAAVREPSSWRRSANSSAEYWRRLPRQRTAISTWRWPTILATRSGGRQTGAILPSIVASARPPVCQHRGFDYTRSPPPGIPRRRSVMDWKHQSILVTGGASFISSHLIDLLVANGAQRVRVVDDLSSGRLANIQSHIDSGVVEFHREDLLGPGVPQRMVEGIDVV